MPCPFAAQAMGSAHISAAIAKCPFLARVSESQGEDVARQIAVRPTTPAQSSLEGHTERVEDFEATFQLFHGFKGIVPLRRVEGVPPTKAPSATDGRQEQQHPALESKSDWTPLQPGLQSTVPFAAVNFSLLGFLPSAHDFFDKLRRQRRHGSAQHGDGLSGTAGPGPGKGPGKGTPSNSSSRGSTRGPGVSTRSSARSGLSQTHRPRTVQSSKRPPQNDEGGRCPLRDWPLLGGLIPLSAKGDLACPPAIMAARAAVARLKPVRELRPQALPVKMLAIGAAGMLANVPCGMWREHLEKFSPGWFVAVHATIPGVALLRKGVVMPKWAIILTIATAAAGQLLGGRVERARLAWMAQARDEAGESGKGGGQIRLPCGLSHNLGGLLQPALAAVI